MVNSQKFRIVAASITALCLGVGGCTTEEEILDDPTTALGDEEWSDEGPLPEDESSDVGESVDDPPGLIALPPQYQLPFPCGQTWAGQTRTAHSPQNSVDFNRTNDIGDTVVAAAAGRVTRVSNTGSTSYGRWIELSHGNGATTRYAHLNSQAVSVGQSVRQGQTIGTVGSTGPHLHYEQRRNGVAVRASFDGQAASYFTTRNYRSDNACASGGGGGGGTASGRINTSGLNLTVRRGATTSSTALGSVADGTFVTITCQQVGQSVSGTYGTSTLWDKIGTGYVADAYVSTGTDGRVAPDCP